MHFQSQFVAFILTTFSSVSASEDLKVMKQDTVQLRSAEDPLRPGPLAGNGNRRTLSSKDKTTILNTFNDERSQVGASDMNYLSWNSSIEEDVGNWTSYCNFDATVYSSTPGEILKYATKSPPDHAAILREFFSDSSTSTTLRSIYLTGVSAAYSNCATVKANGEIYTNMNLIAYGIPYTSNFRENVKQYTNGAACTRCQSGVNWCYDNLCRGDCNNSTWGCCPITDNAPMPCRSSNTEFQKSVIYLGILLAVYYQYL